MKNRTNNPGDGLLERYSSLSIPLIYNLVTLAAIIIFYPLVPILMGYSPNFRQVTVAVGAGYNLQYIAISVFTLLIGSIIFGIVFREIGKWNNLSLDNAKDAKTLSRIRKKCINYPYVIYISQLTVVNLPLIAALIIIKPITNVPTVVCLKLVTIIFSIFFLSATFSQMFSKKIFTNILLRTYDDCNVEGIRIGLKTKIFLQIIPLSIIAILFTSLLGYTRVIEEKGDQIYEICRSSLDNSLKDIGNIEDEDQVFDVLSKINIKNAKTSYFAIRPDKKIVTSDGRNLTEHFMYFIKNPVNGDRIYGDTIETQGVIRNHYSVSGNWLIGIKFEMASDKTVMFIIFSFFALLGLNIIVLYYFSKTLAGDISMVAESLMEIAEGDESRIARKLAVTSNDEIADLVVAFNKIQEREKQHLKEIEEKHAVLMEQERLASLGNLIGGIAHNLRSPIMSISGAIEGLKDLVEEYDESIDDRNVKREDHHEIAGEMKEWINKMKPYCSYMSDIITAVKEQTMQPNEQHCTSFTIDELDKRVHILMEHELKKRHCRLVKTYNISLNTRVKGDISMLVQVLNNLIANAVDSYDDRSGIVELIISKNEESVEFIVKDYGKGITKEVQEKLFKQMVTTKGARGTGLGLYISYSNIKARFGGKMWFVSEEGNGTSFFINIPYINN